MCVRPIEDGNSEATGCCRGQEKLSRSYDRRSVTKAVKKQLRMAVDVSCAADTCWDHGEQPPKIFEPQENSAAFSDRPSSLRRAFVRSLFVRAT